MCDARQYSDQMLCDTCGLQWDVNDPEPPECQPVALIDEGDGVSFNEAVSTWRR